MYFNDVIILNQINIIKGNLQKAYKKLFEICSKLPICWQYANVINKTFNNLFLLNINMSLCL